MNMFERVSPVMTQSYAVTRERDGYHVRFRDGREDMGPFPGVNGAFDAISADARARDAVELLHRIDWWRVGVLAAVPLTWLAYAGVGYLAWWVWNLPWPPAGWGAH